MSASPIRENECRSCGAELPAKARFCSNCGAAAGDVPPLETVPGPIAHDRVERHWLGLPARFVLLCVGFAALGAAIGLFATGSWAWGIVALAVAAIVLAVLVEAVRRTGGVWVEHSSRLASNGRAQAVTMARVWRTRFDSSVARWRTRSRIEGIELARGPALQALGDAVWRGDATARRKARHRLAELEQERQQIEDELAQRLVGAEERIRRARLPVQETMMVTPDEPNPPYPPPGEGDPPQPAQVPEPYPPPDEGTPPTPAPDPGRTDE